MPINEAFLQELKYKTDIDDVISAYVSLRRRGSTSVGLCPFHNEKTPSFTVYSDTQSFYCFGCGAGGDAVTFIKRIENLDYMDAVKLLAQRAGLQMPDDNTVDNSLTIRRRRILEINRETAKFYYSYLIGPHGRAGLDYYLGRGLSKNTIKKFGLGYAPDEWDALLKHLKGLGYKPSEMVDAGVVKIGRNNNYYDTFKNRVMTPIIDVRGNVIAFGGRVLDDSKPKYINTSDTLVYKKTYELFGLNLAKNSDAGNLILCEGYMDVIAMHQAGFTNAVAGCGTALTSEQVRLISRYTNEVILAYDADEAGQKALAKAVRLFRDTDVKTRIPSLVGGKDPDEIIRKFGRDKFKGMLDGASNETEFALHDLINKHNLATPQGKIDYVKDAIKILAGVSPVEKDIYATRLSQELSIDKESIKIQLDDYSKKLRRNRSRQEYKSIINDDMRSNQKLCYDSNASLKQVRAEERLIGLLQLYPSCIKMCSDFNSDEISTPLFKKIYELLCSKINNNMGIDLINFSENLTDDEIGRFSGIIARCAKNNNHTKEFSDCIDTIHSEYIKKHSKKTSEMTDDEFRSMFNKNN